MKRNEKKTSLTNITKTVLPVGIYIVICAIGISALIGFFNRLIEKHDRELSQQMCSLLTEKVTSSLEYLTNSAYDLSVMIANDKESGLDEIYERLSDSKSGANYTSIGLILDDGTVYATESEKSELEKQEIVASANKLGGTMISKPYRSVVNGQMVFTVLSSIVRNGNKIGSLFVTYHFSDIVELAYSDNIDKSTEVWLMDLQSLNIILCAGPKEALVGTWSNLNLDYDMSESSNLTESIALLRGGMDKASVTYKDDGETYTHVFEKIPSMEGWSVVVRIPNKAFSSTIGSFRSVVRFFTIGVVGATMLLLVVFMLRFEKEKESLENLTTEVIRAFARAVDYNDPYTAGHSRRVGRYSREIARRLGMNEEECRDVYYCGLLHDVGKLGIDNTIINKPGKLTDDEYDEIKKHPDMGYEILNDISLHKSYAIGAKYHHERVDGKGYPNHETDIPLVGRIIAVADAYDAMTSRRPYRDALPQAEVREQLEKNAGTQFDENIAGIMIKMIDEDKDYKMRQK